MRRFMTVPLAGLIALAVAGPVAAGPNVGNFSNSATIAQASWDGYDEATETYRSGFVAVSKEQGSSQAFAEYSQYQEQFVQCTGADTPDDPDDDSFGVISSNRCLHPAVHASTDRASPGIHPPPVRSGRARRALRMAARTRRRDR